jgi:hypothetical protein
LTKYEILLLPYDCIWIEGDKDEKDEFTTLVGKYKLLSAIERGEIIDESHNTFFISKGLYK